jgi:hypothetical protein
MTIRLKTALGAAMLVGASTLITSRVVSQQYEDKMQDHDKMMEMWMEMAKPGREHKRMAEAAGTWLQESKMWMEPGADPVVNHSVAEFAPIMGGRYMLERVAGVNDYGGGKVPFEGLCILGFDKFKQKHVFAWIDNMSTMIMMAEGTADATGDVITYMSEMPDPMSGGSAKVKFVSRSLDDDTNMFEMHMQGPDGEWMKNMEQISTRAQ